MDSCFVIQPYDGGKFDKRYRDTFEPAINAAGLLPYRVDHDPSVEIPIKDIESGIQRATICLAEITKDSPNVWYELGFAFATQKPVVMVCDSERQKFPFDVQHRQVIRYSSESPSDFKTLELEITTRLKAVVARQSELTNLREISPIAATAGLTQHEQAALVIIAGLCPIPGDLPTMWTVKQDMNQAGFEDIAVTLATRSLLKKGYIAESKALDDRGNDYTGVMVSESGLEWLQGHEELLVLRTKPKTQLPNSGFEMDDLPF